MPVDPEFVCCRKDRHEEAGFGVSPTWTRPFRTGHAMAVAVWPFSELRLSLECACRRQAILGHEAQREHCRAIYRGGLGGLGGWAKPGKECLPVFLQFAEICA